MSCREASPRSTCRSNLCSRPSCPWQNRRCRSGSLPTASFAPQPQQQTGFAAHSRRAAHVFAMAAARAVLFLISIVCSLESLIRNPPKIKHPQATAAQVDGGIGAVFHRAGQGVLDLLRPFALINRWRPLGRVPAPSLPLAVHGEACWPGSSRKSTGTAVALCLAVCTSPQYLAVLPIG